MCVDTWRKAWQAPGKTGVLGSTSMLNQSDLVGNFLADHVCEQHKPCCVAVQPPSAPTAIALSWPRHTSLCVLQSNCCENL